MTLSTADGKRKTAPKRSGGCPQRVWEITLIDRLAVVIDDAPNLLE